MKAKSTVQRVKPPDLPHASTAKHDLNLVAKLYRAIFRIRRVEEEIVKVYPTDKIQSPVHLSIGQEAVSVGVCEALNHDDIVFGSYRSHALYLAKGGNLNAMIAELYGKVTGCAKGKAGSMHLIDVQAGVMGASAVVATTIPEAVGYALSMKMRGERRVVASFFGDGAVEEGVFHESLNFAALKKLPVVFVCENNDFAIHSRQAARQSTADICGYARSHGIPAVKICDMNTLTIHDKVRAAAAAIRRDHSGPVFFECVCYRWLEHVGPSEDYHFGYRQKADAEPWIKADELVRLGAMLGSAQRDSIGAEVEAEILEAFDFAERSPFPDDKELYTDLFADS